jgi:hypothetical protein
VKSILSEEGKQLLVVNNFKFCVARKLNDDEIRWGSVNKKSKYLAKVHPEEENIERQALSNGVKRKALDNLTHKPAKLLRQQLRQNGFLDQIFTYDVDRAMKAARRRIITGSRAQLGHRITGH